MKTPQEEAEEMASQVLPYQEMCNCSSCKKQLKDMLTAIPLPELIAVARAAEELNSNCIPVVGSFDNNRSYVYTCDSDKLEAALQALRATGKVEGICR